MPSYAETLILLSVLAAVFASLPLALLGKRLLATRLAVITVLLPPLLCQSGLDAPEEWRTQPPPVKEWSRADGWFALVLAVMVAVLLGPVSMLLMMKTGGGEAGPKVAYTSSLFVTQIVFQAGVIGLVMMWLVGVRKFNAVRLFGLKERSLLMTPLLALFYLLIAWGAVALIANVLMPLMQKLTGMELKQQGLVQSMSDIESPTTRVLMVITLCVGAPLMEELIFRGVIYRVTARFTHPAYANAASSLLFGVIHNNLLSLIPLTVLGMFLAEAYRRSRSLAVPVLMHAMFNGISFLLLTYGPPELRQ